ncbi:MAG: serine/threonine protein kinase [Anaerolineae bacterium]|nr:serine/threonine protein kinase [Gemmatimonadaceae bacterium]
MRNLVLEILNSGLEGRYTIEREIGQGGAATIYLAHDLENDRPVAVKVLRGHVRSPHATDRFLREINLLTRLRHPHILALFDSGNARGLLYYVTPYIAGESLHSRLSREKQVPIPEAVTIALEVADALDYAHRENVMHRDIKPGNILLDGGHATVADFGIARAIRESGEAVLTASGSTLGTPAYMSPEQVLGERDIDGRSDIYGLASVLFEMVTGQQPFMGSRGVVENHRKFTDPAPRARAVRSDLPAALDDTLATAMAKYAKDRFATAGEFGEALSKSVA